MNGAAVQVRSGVLARRLRLGLAAALAAAAALGALALAGVLHSTRAPTPPHPVLLLAPASGPAITVGAHPVGLSIEYPLLIHDLGSGRCPPAALVRALATLGSPVLRIGGDSQDELAPAGTPVQGDLSDLPARFWTQLGCLERETAVPVVVGLNLAWGRPAWAARLAAGARAVIPAPRLSFELGNEPDIYGLPVRWWNGHALDENRMPRSIYLRRARALAAALGPGASIEGPDFASGRWTAAVPMLARTLHLATIDAHFYPLEGCAGRDDATIAALLSRWIQSKLDERVRFAIDARAAGLPAVISEANSVSCGGVAGISDQPATAVWALRMVLNALRDGFSSVRFHSSGGSYDPLVVSGQRVLERPLFTGMRVAAQLLVPGSTLRAIPNAGALGAVAITTPSGARSVVVSNYGAAPAWVALRAHTPARVLRLLARAPTTRTAAVATAAPDDGRVELELAPGSVEAITLAPRRARARRS